MRADRPPIETRGLTKDYGNGRGIFDLDLVVDRSEVFGFLGPNGAGKSTTIRQLMGLARPTLGSAEILGLDCQRDSVELKRHIGYLPGELPQFGGWKGGEVVAYLAGLRGGVEPGDVRRIAERFELDLGQDMRGEKDGRAAVGRLTNKVVELLLVEGVEP